MCSRADAVLLCGRYPVVIWIVIGYTLAFTEGNPFFGGLRQGDAAGHCSETLARPRRPFPNSCFVMFQLTFAIITPSSSSAALRTG